MIDLDHPLELADLEHSFGSVQALAGVSLSVAPGTVHAVLGPNGAGKSTTIAASVGLLKPQAGTVSLFGLDPITDHTLTGSLAGVMLQDGGLPAAAKPLQVLSHLARLYREPADYRALATRLGIDSFANRSIRRLSGGQKQRVALAAALVGKPRLVFLDEPTAGLDPQAMLAVHDVIHELRNNDVAVVLTTHDMDDAQTLADQVTIIDHGTVIAQGSPAELAGSGQCAVRFTLCQPLNQHTGTELDRFGHLEIRGLNVVLTGTFTTADLSAILDILSRGQVQITGFHMASRSLGDVFLDLTGRNLR